MMLLGSVLGNLGFEIPVVETGIALSLVCLGALVAWGRTWPLGLAMALSGSFAVFHGYAHGVEIPSGSGRLSYSVGLTLATVALHVTGFGAALGLLKHGRVMRLSGAAVTLVGLWFALS